MGVAPGTGWIADYPVTPDILGELEAAVADAANAGRLAASEEEALYAFQEVAAGFGLAVAAAPQKGDLQEEGKTQDLRRKPTRPAGGTA